MGRTGVEFLLYGYAVLVVATAAEGWRRTARLLGGLSLGPVRQMIRFLRETKQTWRFAGLAAAALAAVAAWMPAFAGGTRVPLAWPVALSATLLAVLMRAIQPPVVLFLTSSSPHAGRLLSQINAGLAPLRGVALLDASRMATPHRLATRSDNLRTRRGDVWKSIVYRLIDMVPIVVIDTRGETDAVRQETLIMLDPGRVRKAVLITTDDRRSPALEVHRIDPRDHALPTVTEGELLPLLRHWTREAGTLPCPVSPGTICDPGPLLPEDPGHLPSVLVIALADEFDSATVVRRACASDRDLLALWFSLTAVTDESARWALDLSWEFAHNPDLALIQFDSSHQVLIRIDFLRRVAPGLRRHVATGAAGPFTFEQLNQPDPIWQAVRALTAELADRARDSEQTCRAVFH